MAVYPQVLGLLLIALFFSGVCNEHSISGSLVTGAVREDQRAGTGREKMLAT